MIVERTWKKIDATLLTHTMNVIKQKTSAALI